MIDCKYGTFAELLHGRVPPGLMRMTMFVYQPAIVRFDDNCMYYRESLRIKHGIVRKSRCTPRLATCYMSLSLIITTPYGIQAR